MVEWRHEEREATRRLERRTPPTSVGTESARLETEGYCHGLRRERGSGEPMDQTRARRRSGSPTPSRGTWCAAEVERRTTGPVAGGAQARSASIWLSWRCVDDQAGGGGDQARVRRELSSSALQPHPACDQAQCAETGAA